MRWLRNPLAILLVGVAFRILLIPSVLKWIGTPSNPFEGNEASHIAAHMVRGDGFASPFTDLAIPTAQQPPLYPLFMAGIFRLFGAASKISSESSRGPWSTARRTRCCRCRKTWPGGRPRPASAGSPHATPAPRTRLAPPRRDTFAEAARQGDE